MNIPALPGQRLAPLGTSGVRLQRAQSRPGSGSPGSNCSPGSQVLTLAPLFEEIKRVWDWNQVPAQVLLTQKIAYNPEKLNFPLLWQTG